MDKLLRIAPAAALLERRLAESLASGAVDAAALRARETRAWAEGVASMPGAEVTAEALERALAASPGNALPDAETVRAWGIALGFGALRTTPLAGGAPPEFVATRLADLSAWLGSDGLAEVKPRARAALAWTRVQDVAPLAGGNEWLAHVALAHALRRLGLRLPRFDAADAAALAAARRAAAQFDFQPLGELLERADGRMLDDLIRQVGSSGPAGSTAMNPEQS
jgi:hypothetical protein